MRVNTEDWKVETVFDYLGRQVISPQKNKIYIVKYTNGVIRKEFWNQLDVLKSKILLGCEPKSLNGTPLDAQMYFDLVESFVQALNQQSIPNITYAWDYVQ